MKRMGKSFGSEHGCQKRGKGGKDDEKKQRASRDLFRGVDKEKVGWEVDGKLGNSSNLQKYLKTTAE